MDASPVLQELFEAYPEINSVYLFGSRARNEDHQASDWDYGILTIESPLLTQRLLELVRDLELYHHMPVDVVDLRRAPPLLIQQILRERKLSMTEIPYCALDLRHNSSVSSWTGFSFLRCTTFDASNRF